MCMKVPGGGAHSHRRDSLSPWNPDVRDRQWGQQRMVKGETGQEPGRTIEQEVAGPRKRKESGNGETRKEAGKGIRRK